FVEWCIGYSVTNMIGSALQTDVQNANTFYYGELDPTAPTPTPVATLSRVIPAQDPEQPWLFATDCDLMEGVGAIVQDPENYLIDQDGHVVLQNPDGKGQVPIVVPAIAYADNDQAGGCAGVGPPQLDGAGKLISLALPTGKFSDGRALYRV